MRWTLLLIAGALFAQPGGQERKLLKQFDKDGDGRLNRAERDAARGGPFAPPKKLTPALVKNYGAESIYDPKVLRTLFLQFESADWERELADFYNTDVEVPATLTVDGKVYPNVGVHFRGMSSFMMAPAGKKRSLNLSLDFVNEKQRLGGVKTLNLLNSNGDATLMRTLLFSHIARQYIPAPKVNYVRVVINGESWGVYVNAQQFNADFIREHFGTTAGARWKTPGSPMGRAGLAYVGDDAGAYKRLYEIKSKDDAKSWAALIELCKVLNETPADKLEAALEPILDIDSTLKFLALDKALVNSDGYWARASDYSLYLDVKGRFHIFPHDMNEALMPAEMMGGFGGPGRGPGGMGGRGFGPPPGFGGPMPGGPMPGGPPREPGNAKLDPFAGSEDPNKPLLHKLLAVPKLREKYLGYVRKIAREWLDWTKLEPMVREAQALIGEDVKADGRKIGSTDAFLKGVDQETMAQGMGPFGGRPVMSLKAFVEQRRDYLLGYQVNR